MIKENELRIGNIIGRNSAEITVGWGTLKAISEGINVGNGIPLTEDRLLKFDFEIIKLDGGIKFSKDGIMIRFYKQENIIVKYSVEYYGVNLRQFNFTVHSLQNLYFALTGQELQFKK